MAVEGHLVGVDPLEPEPAEGGLRPQGGHSSRLVEAVGPSQCFDGLVQPPGDTLSSGVRVDVELGSSLNRVDFG